jgi:hypothetical protein
MDLIHGYIYSTAPEPDSPPVRSFFQRHLRGFGIALSLIFHLSLFGWIFYQGVIAPFTDMAFIDEAYNEVKWIEISKLTQPLKYPPSLLPQPGRALRLEELERRRQEAEQKAKAAKKKREKKEVKEDEEEAKQEENEKTEETAGADNESEIAEPDEPEKPAGPPRFGLINARPIREIIGKVYTVYKSGGLDIEKTVFSITLGFDVREDGSLINIRILNSSGSEQIDTAAVNIANAISESHALMPLAALNSTTATLNLNAEQAVLKIAGFTDTTTVATDLATTFSQQLAGLRLLMSLRNQDAATLLSHLEVSNKGNELSAILSMTRAEASILMRKNFGNLVPANQDKQPEVSDMNLMNGLSKGSNVF